MIFFLGLDGLDKDLVEQWNCTTLMQSEYGNLKVPISSTKGVPISPEVWYAFLTGKYPSENLDFEIRFPFGTIGEKLGNIAITIRKHVPIGLGLAKSLGRKRFPKLTSKTFLDEVNSAEFNAPGRGYDQSVFDIYGEWKDKQITYEECVQKIFKLCEDRKTRIMSLVDRFNSVNVTFAYIEFPDSIEHLTFLYPDILRQHYLSLNKFVKHFKSLIKFDNFIIVADHGFDLKKGNHSLLGFYSSHKSITPKPKDITDFYRMILQ